MLNAEADAICNASRYQRSPDRLDTRAGSYKRKLLTKAGEVELQIPRLRTLPVTLISRKICLYANSGLFVIPGLRELVKIQTEVVLEFVVPDHFIFLGKKNSADFLVLTNHLQKVPPPA